jgi:hypothetical protein
MNSSLIIDEVIMENHSGSVNGIRASDFRIFFCRNGSLINMSPPQHHEAHLQDKLKQMRTRA